ncbi:MAG: sensor histidine kinase [Elusimicrobiota bacterium]
MTRDRGITLSARIEFGLSVLFLVALVLATAMIYQSSRQELEAKRAAVAKELGYSLELTNQGLEFLLNPDIIPALIRSRDRGRAEKVFRKFIAQGAELSAVVVTRDLTPFAAIPPESAVTAERVLREFAGTRGEGAGFLFLPAAAGGHGSLVIRHLIVDSGRVDGILFAEADMDHILRRIAATHFYPLPVGLAGLSVEGTHPRPVLDAPIRFGDVFSNFARYRLGAGLLILFTAAVLYALCRLMVRKMVFPFELLVAKLDAAIKGDRAAIDVREYPVWFRPFIGNINRLIVSVVEAQERERRAMATQALQETASQVAHDIRSPLAALEVAAGDVSQLPEDKRLLIRGAVGRIRDIANSLLDKNRAVVLEKNEAASHQLLSSLVDSLATEKRLQFRSRSRVEIEAWLDASSYGIFAKVQPVEFKRLLSNLIDNSVEAIGLGPGTVRLRLSVRDGRALASVQDDGQGIAPEVLAKLGRRGETYGKAGGSGLGLHHARASAASWGGRLAVASEVGKGTTMTVDLPQAEQPDWFVSELALMPGRAVLILDDDESIHHVWQGRLDALRARESGVEIVHVYAPGEIRAWVKGNPGKAREARYLLDYELFGYRETGLSLAEELGIGKRSVLVTSHYEESEVLEGCRKLKARMIPKGLAGLVPIRIEYPAPAGDSARRLWDAVLIDDDPLARMTWKLAAERAGRKFRTFSTTADFLEESDAIDRRTPVYLDAELGNGVKGDAESLRIHELGFGEIFLATGYEPGRFAGLAHLRGVVGKDPPWKS